MSYSIHFEAKALKKASRKTARMRLVIYKTNHNRVYKTLPYSVNNIEWDNNRKRLKSGSSQAVELNPLLDALQGQLSKQVLLWENKGYDWTPKELCSVLNGNKSKESQKSSDAQNSVVYWIDYQIKFFNDKERFKNGEVVKGSSNAKNYQWLKNFLEDFTKEKYKKDFSAYQFKDITESFLRAFVLYIKKRGHSQGNKAGLSHKLKNFKAVFNIAITNGRLKDVNLNVFSCIKADVKQAKTTPKTTSKANIELIKNYDRKELPNKECFWLDLFLFSYYAGGMPNVDVCYLNTSSLKENYIEYTRQKCDKVASPAFLPQMRAIIDKYSHLSYSDYVLPIFSHKQQTELQKRQKVERITANVNKTLRKVCMALGITDKITWYSARGTYITNMIDAGVNPHAIADQAGNSVKVIEKHYYKANRTEMLNQIRSAI